MEFDWTGVVDYSKRNPLEAPRTQYELPGVTEEDHQGVPVAVAQVRLTAALAEVELVYPLGPGGIFVQVSYGLPYFRDRIPGTLTDEHFPKSTMAGSEGEWAVIDSIRFPKDP